MDFDGEDDTQSVGSEDLPNTDWTLGPREPTAPPVVADGALRFVAPPSESPVEEDGGTDALSVGQEALEEALRAGTHAAASTGTASTGAPSRRSRAGPPSPSQATSGPQAEVGGLEDCLELVRRALQRAAERGGGAPATPCAPGWDADTTLTLSHHDALARTPETILEARRVITNDWTHLQLRPSLKRARVLTAEDARDLYVGVGAASYRQGGMGVMERRLSDVTRLSLWVRFADTDPPPNATGVAAALAFLCPRVYDSLNVGATDRAARLCIVLRAAEDALVDPATARAFVFHWPEVAVRRTDVDGAWCADCLGGDPHWAATVSLTPRNVQSFYPMYGCTDGTTPALWAWAVYDDARLCPDVGAALRSWMTSGGTTPSVGVGLRLPVAPSTRTLEAALPLLCSINPMGARVFRPPDRQALGVAQILERLPAAERAGATRAVRLLRCLRDDRRHTPTQQNAVGALVYDMTGGRWSGFTVWLAWVHGWRDGPPVDGASLAAFMEQWRMFALRTSASSGYDGAARLRSLVQQDAAPAQWQRLLREEALETHARREHPDDTVRLLGSLTHMDLAQYVWHHLQSTVVCASAAGRGLWYVYDPSQHRWYFDRPGARRGPPAGARAPAPGRDRRSSPRCTASCPATWRRSVRRRTPSAARRRRRTPPPHAAAAAGGAHPPCRSWSTSPATATTRRPCTAPWWCTWTVSSTTCGRCSRCCVPWRSSRSARTSRAASTWSTTISSPSATACWTCATRCSDRDDRRTS